MLAWRNKQIVSTEQASPQLGAVSLRARRADPRRREFYEVQMPIDLRRLFAHATLVALVLLAIRADRAAAAAPCVVGSGTAPSCTEAALDACLPGGAGFTGVVTFDCGGAATIVVSATKELSADTAIDGGGVITLDGGDAVRVLHVATGTTASLAHLTIAHGFAADSYGGGGVLSEGNLTVSDTTFFSNAAASLGGGGLLVLDGSIELRDSVFSQNRTGACGGGALLYGTAHVAGCVFSGNHSDSRGGGLCTAGSYDGAVLVEASAFYDNVAGQGGGYFNAGAATTLTDLGFYSNAAQSGGGVAQGGRLLTVARSTFVANVADSGGGIWNGSYMDLSNVTLFANAAIANAANPNGEGGGIWSGGFLHIANTTITGNTASAGGGLASFGITSVANSIIAANPSGGNCLAPSPVTDAGHNLDDANTCLFAGAGCTSSAGTSLCGVAANLDPLGPADHGGATQTIALCTALGTPPGCPGASPAIGAGDQTICAATTGDAAVGGVDQRGYGRPGTGQSSCSIGAFEPGATRPCPASPLSGCRSAGNSTLSWRRDGGARDTLSWRWTNGDAMAPSDFGFPTVSTQELLCLYGGPSSALVSELHVPLSATRWRPSPTGYVYSDRTGAAAGIHWMRLKGGASGKSLIAVRGAGTGLPDPALEGITAPLTVQLLNDTTDVCAEAVFDASAIAQQSATRLKAQLRR